MSSNIDLESTDSLRELLSIYTVLMDDNVKLGTLREAMQDEAALRRAYFRSIFAWIEGTLFVSKQNALFYAPYFQVEWSHDELEKLTERRLGFNSDGTPRSGGRFLPIADNLAFTLSALAKSVGGQFTVVKSGSDWQRFLRIVAKRNALTHPKSFIDVQVTDSELEDINKTGLWFTEQFISVLDVLGQKLKGHRIQKGKW